MITLRPALLFLVYFCCLGSTPIQSDVIVFDMGGVLVQKSSLRSCWYIGLRNFLGIYNPFSVERTLFNFLDTIEVPTQPYSPSSTVIPLYHGTRPLPRILCNWLAGTISHDDIHQIIDVHIESQSDLFVSDSHKALIRASAHFMFNPKLLAKVIYPLKDGVALLKKCYKKRDVLGKRQHRIYILSNWDSQSFTYMMQNPKLNKILKYCDGVMISGDVHLIKPDPALFNHFLKTYDIDPFEKRVIFIDDQEENIQAAQSVGMHAIVCKYHSTVKKELKQLGVI